MPNQRFRVRVQRLLSGNIQSQDLYELFSFARDNAGGRDCVREIGHFVAHTTTRDKGITVQAARNWAAVARFHLARFGRNNLPPISDDCLPAATKAYFSVAFDLIPASVIREETLFSRHQARERMETLIKKLTLNDDGTWAMPWGYSTIDSRLLKCAAKWITPRPAFSADSLVDEFLSVLKNHKLITLEEIDCNKLFLSECIALFAISKMHNCKIDLGDGTFSVLKAWANVQQSRMKISLGVPCTSPNRPDLTIATNMFVANIDPLKCCDPTLTAEEKTWDFDIELNSQCKIVPIV
jgi:hypothetical protein